MKTIGKLSHYALSVLWCYFILVYCATEMCNLPFLRLMINHDCPGVHPDRIKQIEFKKLAALRIIQD